MLAMAHERSRKLLSAVVFCFLSGAIAGSGGQAPNYELILDDCFLDA